MQRRDLVLAAAPVAVGLSALGSRTAWAQAETGLLLEPARGTLPLRNRSAFFRGNVRVTELVYDRQLRVRGVIDGLARDGRGGFTRVRNQAFDVPATLSGRGGILDDTAAAAAVAAPRRPRCDILILDIGPIDLNLLGLVIDLSAIDLDIFALPGPGNLLGNLLCALVGLFDGLAAIGSILDLIERINDLLGGSLVTVAVRE